MPENHLPPDLVLPIDQVKIPERHRVIMGDIDRLMQSIHDVGIIDPIVITPEYELRHGGRRMEAARRLKIKEVPVRFYRADVDPLIIERESQCREDYRPSEKVALANAILSKLGDGRSDKGTEGRVEGQRHDVACKEAGFESPATFRRARKVTNQGSEALIKAMDDGAVPISQASRIADLTKPRQDEVIRLLKEGIGVDKAIEEATGHGPRAPAPADAGDAYEDNGDQDQDADQSVRDQMGNTIPYRMLDCFRSPILEDAARLLKATLVRLQSVHKWNPYLPISHIQQYLDTVANLLMAARPFSICPACGGILEKLDACLVCRHSGFLDENTQAEQSV